MLNTQYIELVDVDHRFARSIPNVSSTSFPDYFVNQPLARIDRISMGDMLTIQVYENIDNGLFSGDGMITPLTVDGEGLVSIPYIGRVQANGRTLEQLRLAIESGLSDQTPNPQVVVSRASDAGLSVTVSGAIRAPGAVPLDLSSRRLSGVLARVGGVDAPSDLVFVEVRRGGKSGKARYKDILTQAIQDIAVLPGDSIFVTAKNQKVTLLGAAGTQTSFALDNTDLKLIDAIASAGGLNAEAANAQAVYVMRQKGLGTARTHSPDALATLFSFDFSGPDGVLAAGAFPLEPDDIIYIAESASTRFNRVVRAMLGAVQPASQLNAIASEF